MIMTAAVTYYRQGKEFFFSPHQILFYEASDDSTYAHTPAHTYRVRFRLYELEALLPPEFLRVSKSAIVNTSHILSFATTVGTTGVVEFFHSHKRLHISRRYIKALRAALKARSTINVSPKN